MKETNSQKRIREGINRIDQKEKALEREEHRSSEAKRYKDQAEYELNRAISTGASFSGVIEDLGVSFSEILSHTMRRIVGRSQ
jgi:hypothetical protein